MNTEDFVTYEQAIRLKELGFDEPCRCYYNSDHQLLCAKECELSPYTTNNRYLDEIADSMASAPTLSQAAKWLREERNIYIQIESVIGKRWTYTLVDTAPQSDMYGEYHDRIFKSKDGYPVLDTYESALSAGIDAALKLIKEKA